MVGAEKLICGNKKEVTSVRSHLFFVAAKIAYLWQESAIICGQPANDCGLLPKFYL